MANLIQHGFLSAMMWPWNVLPLTFIISALLYQRVNPYTGFLWLILSLTTELFLGFSSVSPSAILLTGILMIPLVERVFENRSIYALVTFTVLSYLILLFIHGIFYLFDLAESQVPVSSVPTRLIIVFIGTICVFLLGKSILSSLYKWFYFRSYV